MALEGRRVLYISYNGMLEPLGQSQVIPYLRELAKLGIKFTLLSFERSAAFEPPGRLRCGELKQELAGAGIEWYWLRYHQTPSLTATTYDVINGIRLAQRLARKNKIEMVHARAHISATIGLALKRRFGLRLIFDLRGLMAEEYEDANHWTRESIPFRLTKSMERRMFAGADAVVTLTEKIWPIIETWDGLCNRRVPHEVIPCCADLQLFRFSKEDRERRRTELNLKERRVLVYSGSIGGWYLTDKIAEMFAAFHKQSSEWFLLWITNGSPEMIRSLMTQSGIDDMSYSIKSVAPREVSSYLSAADAGVAFYKPTMSRLATSPVKLPEYLACGLPVIINSGIGDSDSLVQRSNLGAVIGDFTTDEYLKALGIIEELSRNAEQTRKHNRAVAKELFDVRRLGVERYARLYETVLAAKN